MRCVHSLINYTFNAYHIHAHMYNYLGIQKKRNVKYAEIETNTLIYPDDSNI
jgi:hypothetical protein